MPRSSKAALLLHVEDDRDDALLIGRAVLGTGINAGIKVVENGAVAADYLSGEGGFEQGVPHPLPDLILLDLNMPVMNGHDFLRWRAQRPSVVGIPVVVLTSSSSEADVLAAYQAGANAYLTKPLEHGQLQEMMGDLTRFWLNWNRNAG